MRPIAASRSWRRRACTARSSSMNSTHSGSSAGAVSLPSERLRVKRPRMCSARRVPSSSRMLRSIGAAGHVPSPTACSTASASTSQPGCRRSENGGDGQRDACATSSRRADGLAARTRSWRSITSTPSAMSSITSRLSCACWRARSRLSRAVRSSCARRIDSSPASRATTNRPMPLRPACDISAAESGTEPATRPAAASSISATPAAVASAGRRGVRMPAISTGSTSSAA